MFGKTGEIIRDHKGVNVYHESVDASWLMIVGYATCS